MRITLRRDDAEQAEIVVEDDGPGVPEHALERIFERFYTDRPDEGFGENSGLGLSISRQIVQAHLRPPVGREPPAAARYAPSEDDEGRTPPRRRRSLPRQAAGQLCERGAACQRARAIGERAILLRGAAGAGKSLLALTLIERVQPRRRLRRA